jgi:hypothetical protein
MASHPPSQTHSKQIKELDAKSHVRKKQSGHRTECLSEPWRLMASSTLSAIVEEERLTDSNIYALISSVEGNIIKSK